MIGIGETWLDYIQDTTDAVVCACFVDVAANKARRMTEPLQMLTLSREEELRMVHEIAGWRKDRGDTEGYELAMQRLRTLLDGAD